MKIVSKIATILLFSSLLFSCGQKEIIYEDVLDPTNIVLNEKEKVLRVGETYQIQAKYIVDDNEKNVDLVYKSLNTSIATVSNTGLVEAKSVGEAIIQITYDKTKSLFKVIVQDSEASSTLGLNISHELISLYENDQFEFRYEARLNGEHIDLEATYSDYNQSIISINNNIITALGIGTTTAKISVTYGELIAEELFTVSVKEAEYYLSCNYENNQVVVDEDNLVVTYSFNYGRTKIKDLSLSEMECTISDNTIASVSGNSIKGLKKGAFELHVSYHVSKTGKDISSTDAFRCREKYTINFVDLNESINVLDGDTIDYIPVNADENLVFDAWLKNNVVYNEPVESSLDLHTRWRINEFDFTQSVKDAKSVAPSEEESTISAVLYNGDDDLFNNGLTYALSKNSHDETQNIDTIAHIYLPKMDYRKCNKVIYHWRTNGWVAIKSSPSNWYDYSACLGGTIEIAYDGVSLTQTIIQNEVSCTNDRITITCDDSNVIQGKANLESLGYWAFTSLVGPNYIYLSNPHVTIINCLTHDYAEVIPTDKIGHFNRICSICGRQGEPSESIMSLADVNFLNQQFGAHGGIYGDLFPIGDNDAFKTEKSLKYEVTAVNEEDEIFLPKIDFSSYEVVQFNVSCSSYAIGVGLDSGSYGLPACEDPNHSTGTLRFKRADNQVIATLTCHETSLSQQVVITDSNIINGRSSFSLFMNSSVLWQTVTIELTILLDECTHNYVETLPTDKIGYFKNICSICDEDGGVTDNAMTITDVNFLNQQYGAHGGFYGSLFPVDIDVFKTERSLKYEVTDKNVEDEIFLPKINYHAFESVSFVVTCGSYAIGAGLESGSYVLPYSANNSDPAHTGVLTLQMNGDNLEASLVCNETSEVQNKVITDEDIINGDLPLSLFMYCPNFQYQTVTIKLIILGECLHEEYINILPHDKIGHYNTACSLCEEIGGASEDVMDFDDVNFTNDTYGAYGGKWGTNVQPTAKTMTYEITAGHVEDEIFLPKIDFSAYSTVTFNFSGNVWDSRVGLESGSYAFPYSASNIHSGTLTFTYNGEQLVVTLECLDGTDQELIITDEDIINGNKAFSLFMTADDPYRTIIVELTSLNQ